MPVHHVETTIVSPSRILIRVRDGDIFTGDFIGPVTPETAKNYDTLYDSGTYKYTICGPDKNWRRRFGLAPDAYLNRVAADVVADWDITGPGSPTITAVYRSSFEYHSTLDESAAKVAQFQHEIELVFDDDLTHLGTYTISFPAGTGLSPIEFTWDDHVTIAEGFRTGHGFRPDDPRKPIYLSSFYSMGPGIPDPDPGELELINAAGTSVATATATQRLTPTSGGNRIVIDASKKAKAVSVTAGIAGTNRINFDGPHPFVEDEPIAMTHYNFSGLTIPSGDSSAYLHNYAWPSAQIIDSDTISLKNRQLRTLAGTVTVSAGGTAVTGTGTAFASASSDYQTLLNVETGLIIRIAGEDRLVASVTDGTHLTLASPHTAGATGATATVHVNGAISGTWASGSLVYRMDGMVYGTRSLNGYGTYLYMADFGDIELPVNTYRARKAGLGVSRTFRIDHNVHFEHVKYLQWGLYHHLQGVEYDGRGGLTHPASMIDGDPHNIYWGPWPSLMSQENAASITMSNRVFPDDTRLLTATRLNPGKPMVFLKDAGDEDSVTYEHHLSLLQGMVVHYKSQSIFSTDALNSLPQEIPLVSEVWGEDHDDLDDLHPELRLYYMVLETFRQAQRVAGEIPSGFGVIAPQNYGGSAARGGGVWDVNRGPLWINDLGRPFAYAHEPTSSYVTGAAFLMLAKLLQLAGKTDRADEFITAAELIKTLNDTLNPAVTGSNTALYTYYKTTLGLANTYFPNDGSGNYFYGNAFNVTSVDATNNRVTATDYYNGSDFFSTSWNGMRVAWIGAPTGITNNTVYYARYIGSQVFEFYDTYAHAIDTGSTTGRVDISGTQTGGRFGYALTDAQVQTMADLLTALTPAVFELFHGFRYFVTNGTGSEAIIEAAAFNGPHSMNGMGHWAWREKDAGATPVRAGQVYDMLYTFNGNTGWHPLTEDSFVHAYEHSYGNGRQIWRGAVEGPHLAGGFILNPDEPDFLNAIISQLWTDTGANTLGVSNIAGMGHRHHFGLLNCDTTTMGLSPPNGFMSYKYDNAWSYSNGSDGGPYVVDGAYHFSADSSNVTLLDNNHYKQMEPLTWSKPQFQQHQNNPTFIFVSEGRHHECELPAMQAANLAHMRGDNTAQAASTDKYLLRAA